VSLNPSTTVVHTRPEVGLRRAMTRLLPNIGQGQLAISRMPAPSASLRQA